MLYINNTRIIPLAPLANKPGITIVAHTKVVTYSLEAADQLTKEDSEAEVIGLRSIRPLENRHYQGVR